MNIGIISNTSNCTWAGSEEVWRLAAEQALEQGDGVTAFLHPDIGTSPELDRFRKNGGLVRTWKPVRIARLQPLKERLSPSFSTSLLDRFDVLLVSVGSLPALCQVPGLAGSLLKTKTPILLLCQFNADHLTFSRTEREILRAVIARCTSVLFVSTRNLHTAERQLAMSLGHASILPNPLRERSEHPLPWPDENGGLSMACVARLETHWKGQDILLDVLRQPRWKERSWTLKFYGNGPDRDYLQSLITFYGLEDRVFLAGYERDMQTLWQQSHLLILPSHGEGTPLALLEAMGMGRPAVVTDAGDSALVIRDGISGFVAPAATVACLDSALERAWERRGDWRTMGAVAHADVLASESPFASRTLLNHLQKYASPSPKESV